MRKYRKNQRIEVDWVDIVSVADWLPDAKAENHPVAICRDIGYFTSQDKDVLRISSSYQLNEKERNVTVIPLGCIKKVRILK